MNKTRNKGNQPKAEREFSFKNVDEKIAIAFMIMKECQNTSFKKFCKIWNQNWNEDFRIENSTSGTPQYAYLHTDGNPTQKLLGRYLLKLYNDALTDFEHLTLNEIAEIRQVFRDARTQENTDKLTVLARSKGLEIFVSDNLNKLSGYRIELLDKKNKCICGVDYNLTYEEAEKYLLEVESLEKIKQRENTIIEALRTDDKNNQLHLIRSHKHPYSTHKFDVDINNLLFRRNKPLNYGVIMALTDMCIRLHIGNPSNGKPIRLLKKEFYDTKAKKGKHRNPHKSKQNHNSSTGNISCPTN